MKTPTKTPRTAADALAVNAAEVDRLLVAIRDQVERDITAHANTKDWGHAGSLGHVVEKLTEVLSFLDGPSS